MFRFLKWIFLIFGGLAISIISFFVYQNRTDLKLAYNNYEKLSYEYQVEHCKDPEGYNYPCFEDAFESYVEQASLTGLSIGLKLAFTYIDNERENTNKFTSLDQKNIQYTINYLRINYLATKECDQRFFGFEYLYSGYLSSIRDFLAKSKQFSINLIKGLRGEDGIAKLNDEGLEQHYLAEVDVLESQILELIAMKSQVNDKKIKRLLDRAEQAKK